MVTGQGAGIAKEMVSRKPTSDLAARDTGRPPTVSERK